MGMMLSADTEARALLLELAYSRRGPALGPDPRYLMLARPDLVGPELLQHSF